MHLLDSTHIQDPVSQMFLAQPVTFWYETLQGISCGFNRVTEASLFMFSIQLDQDSMVLKTWL
jgi:hypothetical protein